MNLRLIIFSLIFLSFSGLIKSSEPTENVNLEWFRIYCFPEYLKFKKFDLNKVKIKTIYAPELCDGSVENPTIEFTYEGKYNYAFTTKVGNKYYCMFFFK